MLQQQAAQASGNGCVAPYVYMVAVPVMNGYPACAPQCAPPPCPSQSLQSSGMMCMQGMQMPACPAPSAGEHFSLVQACPAPGDHVGLTQGHSKPGGQFGGMQAASMEAQQPPVSPQQAVQSRFTPGLDRRQTQGDRASSSSFDVRAAEVRSSPPGDFNRHSMQTTALAPPPVADRQRFCGQWQHPVDQEKQSSSPAEGPAPVGSGSSGNSRRTHRRQRSGNQQAESRKPNSFSGHPPMRFTAGDVAFAQGLNADLKAGGKSLASALATLREPGMIRRLSFEAAGCRVVQHAIEVADKQNAVKLATKLRTSVVEAIASPHANFVIQKLIKVLKPAEVPFVVQEMAESTLDFTSHEYGCRICCRLLEGTQDERTMVLMDKLLSKADELVRHTFGHHVAECALEHGLPHQRQVVIGGLRRSLNCGTWNRNATYVLEKAVPYCKQEDRDALICGLQSLPQGMALSQMDISRIARLFFLQTPSGQPAAPQQVLGQAPMQMQGMQMQGQVLAAPGQLGHMAPGQVVRPAMFAGYFPQVPGAQF